MFCSAPLKVGLLDDVVTRTQVFDLYPILRLAQDTHDLLFAKTASFYAVLLFSRFGFRSQNYLLSLSHF